MRSIILFDDDNWQGLLPLTYTKPICELRIGILSIREKWEKRLEGRISYITQEYLSEKYPIHITEDNIIINSSILPTDELASIINDLPPNEAIIAGDELLAARIPGEYFHKMVSNQDTSELKGRDISDQLELCRQIIRPYDIFRYNSKEILKDFQCITAGKISQTLHESNRVLHPENVFIEEGAQVHFSIINATEGPVYIGHNAIVLEGSLIKGPFSLGDQGVIKMGAKIYGGTSVGPHSKVGGEIKESVIMGYSNKSHDGYLGDSVIGEWCNLGADTNTSNLKNNYEEIKLWNYSTEKFEKTGLQFCGLIMGDHTKCGINTMFNTGTTVGVSCNLYGAGYHKNFIPSFTWGEPGKPTTYNLTKAIQTAEKVMARKMITYNDQEKQIMEYIFQFSGKWRKWA